LNKRAIGRPSRSLAEHKRPPAAVIAVILDAESTVQLAAAESDSGSGPAVADVDIAWPSLRRRRTVNYSLTRRMPVTSAGFRCRSTADRAGPGTESDDDDGGGRAPGRRSPPAARLLRLRDGTGRRSMLQLVELLAPACLRACSI